MYSFVDDRGWDAATQVQRCAIAVSPPKGVSHATKRYTGSSLLVRSIRRYGRFKFLHSLVSPCYLDVLR